MTDLRRHALVWLSRAPAADNGSDAARASDWHAAGRPFVVTRRRDDGLRAGSDVGLGFCTTDPVHPELRPRRIAARTALANVVRRDRPPLLSEIARCPAAAPHALAFGRLQEAASGQSLEVRVYGSWMWQALTNERHVHEASDLDVVIDVAGAAQADYAAAFLAAQEAALGLRIDGELSLAGLGEVHWREFRQGKPDVLLKTIDGMQLVPREGLGA